eukprot:15906293-Heterocapsa_arctica.AAC.1
MALGTTPEKLAAASGAASIPSWSESRARPDAVVDPLRSTTRSRATEATAHSTTEGSCSPASVRRAKRPARSADDLVPRPARTSR